jgi:hypothetical protein
MISIDAVKLTLKVVTGLGVSKVVSDIITNNTTIITAADQVRVYVGSAVIGAMVAEHTGDFIDDTVDKGVTSYNAVKDRQNAKKTEIE